MINEQRKNKFNIRCGKKVNRAYEVWASSHGLTLYELQIYYVIIESGNRMITQKDGCLGCDACQRNGGTCIQKDDMAEIKAKMINADAIVLTSPICFYSMSSQLKALIDRTYAFYTKLESKTFYFIITCAATDESYTKTMLNTVPRLQ